MAHNPLLGSRISLISKKNIRYEGTLYSINETDATVALQNVRSYGTEDRETDTFAAPQDQVHPYLLFRGCDIKDLHVHESSTGAGADKPPSDPAIVSSDKPPEIEEHDEDTSKKAHKDIEPAKSTKQDHCEGRNKEEAAPAPAKAMSMAKPRRNKNTNQNRPKQMVGNGASLLNRKARGVVDGADGPDKDMEKDFDFESNLAEFAKEEDDDDVSYEEEEDAGAYSKDDFFDSISNDALDRQSGFDNRLRGASERTLNTETFGATSLGNNRRFRKRGGGRGGRGRGGRGTGRGRGREGGRRQYGDGRMASTGGRSSNNSREGERRQYGDGGISGTGGGGSHGVREGGGRRQYGDGGISSTGGEGSNGAWRTVN